MLLTLVCIGIALVSLGVAGYLKLNAFFKSHPFDHLEGT